MKKRKLILLILAIKTISSLAQTFVTPFPTLSRNIDTIYVNEEMEEVPKGKKFTYYRIMEKVDDSLFVVKDYYKKGQLKMSGAYKSADQQGEVGEFVWYTEKGEQLQSYNYQKEKVLVKSYEYGFKVEFPKEPSMDGKILKRKKGTLTTVSFICLDSITKTLSGVIYYEYPNNPILKDSMITGFKHLTDNWKEKNGKIIAEKEIEFKGYPGREIQVETNVNRNLMTMRAYLVKNKMYMIIGGSLINTKDINNPTSRFFDSFDLIDD